MATLKSFFRSYKCLSSVLKLIDHLFGFSLRSSWFLVWVIFHKSWTLLFYFFETLVILSYCLSPQGKKGHMFRIPTWFQRLLLISAWILTWYYWCNIELCLIINGQWQKSQCSIRSPLTVPPEDRGTLMCCSQVCTFKNLMWIL